jgi:hypothetical protein
MTRFFGESPVIIKIHMRSPPGGRQRCDRDIAYGYKYLSLTLTGKTIIIGM